MLEEVGPGSRIFLKAEPSNQYDKNAYKVLVWKYDKFNHVGYVQRHSAAKIASVMQGPSNPEVFEVYNNRDIYVVGRLRNATGKPDMFEVEINGAIYDPKSLIDRDEKVKNDTGIFGGKKKPVMVEKEYQVVDPVTFQTKTIKKMVEENLVSKKYLRDQYGYVDYDIDQEMFGGMDEADCF
jgi:hypothetical protein